MYASVRKYQTDADRVDELMHRVDETFAPRIESTPGFVGYQAIDCGDGIVISVSTFADSEGVERSIEMAQEFIRDELADVEIERLDVNSGAVSVSRAASPMLEPAHA
jgi:hypothetical protein